MRYTFNLKKAYDDYYLYSHNTVYGKGERPRSEYVSPYKENRYIPEHNIKKRMCYNKLGQYEDIDESPEKLAKIKKALEIIKGDFFTFIDFKEEKRESVTGETITYYFIDFNRGAYGVYLPKEKWDLLKEILA